MLNYFKKLKKLIIKSTLKPKVFLILFCLFFSSLAFAAALTVTWLDGRIPPGNSACNSFDGDQLNSDSTEDPTDVHFSEDGLMVFTTNLKQEQSRSVGNLSMNKLSTPFDMTSVKTSNGSTDCNDLNAFKVTTAAGGELHSKLENMKIVQNGKKFFILDINGELGRFDLSTPNDFSTRSYVGKLSFSNEKDSFALSRDGTKVFTLNSTNNAPVVTTWALASSYDVSSSPTNISQLDLSSMGVELTDGSNDNGRDIEFNDTGSAMFVLISNYTESGAAGSSKPNSYIYQFRLGLNFDISTASLVGKYQVADFGNVHANREGTGEPRGFSFSSDGMKLYITDLQTNTSPAKSVDQINSFQLECPFGVVACVSDSTSSIGSQIELSKLNISLNVSTIFKRFEWIKRNRDQENLTSHNININYPNPFLKSLAMSLEPTAKKTIATLISAPKKDKKKSKWSSWSLGDLSLSHFDKLGFENAKKIRTEGITYGADRKFSDNKFFGWAIRYGDNRSNINRTKQNIQMDSLTLNLYGIMPKDKERYINAVLGLSALKIDSLYLGKSSGRRYGKQLFTSINFRTNNTFGKLNITPSSKLTFGITRLGEYTDFLSDVIDSPTQNIRYEKDTFTNGEFSGGFLFEADQVTINDKTFQPMGGIEMYYDISRDIDYNYSLLGSSQVNTDTIDGAYSKANLKTSLGFELIYPNGLTLSPMYEKTFGIKGTTLNGTTEIFIIKVSRSKESDDNDFALNFDPLNQNFIDMSFKKNFGNFNLKLDSNYSLFSKIPDYGANIEVSGTF